MNKIVLILTVCALLLCLGGCKYVHDIVYSDVERALVELPGGTAFMRSPQETDGSTSYPFTAVF